MKGKVLVPLQRQRWTRKVEHQMLESHLDMVRTWSHPDSLRRTAPEIREHGDGDGVMAGLLVQWELPTSWDDYERHPRRYSWQKQLQRM